MEENSTLELIDSIVSYFRTRKNINGVGIDITLPSVDAGTADAAAKELGARLGISQSLAALFALTMELCVNARSRYERTTLSDVADMMDITAIRALKLVSSFQELKDYGLIKYIPMPSVVRSYVSIPSSVIRKITRGEELKCEKHSAMDMGAGDMIEAFNIGLDNLDPTEPDYDSFVDFVEGLIEMWKDNCQFAEMLYDSECSNQVKTVFLGACSKAISGSGDLDLTDFLDRVYGEDNCMFYIIKDNLMKADDALSRDGYMKAYGQIADDMQLHVTEKALELIVGKTGVEDLKKKTARRKSDCERSVVRSSASIKERKLYFSADMEHQIDIIEKALSTEGYESVCRRMENKGMRKGLTIMFYGYAGTGKTELCLQLARRTGRDIFQVDMSQTRSMWFGESEKQVKEIFTRYNAARRTQEVTPILLLNEADALLQCRQQLGHSNTAGTENAIQNVLLECLENFEGILVATTNLVENMDSAFERRFLWKVFFDRPTNESRMRIWKDRMPSLTDEECMQLATSSSISGGQIDNVVRKVNIEEVLTGHVSSVQEIMDLCSKEKYERMNSGCGPIGF